MTASKVYLIRHAEKLGGGGDDHLGGPNLSVRGSARAVALPSLFLPAAQSVGCAVNATGTIVSTSFVPEPIAGVPPRFDVPDLIFATADSHGSSRPRQTATPTAIALDRALDATSFSKSPDDATRMGAAFRNDRAFDGRIILVFWHHGEMQAVARALGVANAPAWPGPGVFDRVWVIDFARPGLAVDDLPQRLLFGDADD